MLVKTYKDIKGKDFTKVINNLKRNEIILIHTPKIMNFKDAFKDIIGVERPR